MGNQVVTSENMLELIEKGRVADFVAPKSEGETKVDEPKVETKTEEVKAEGEQQTAPETAAEQKKPEAAEDDLPERAQQRINAKHRQMKEAEEFGKAQYLEKLAAEKRVGELEAKVAELEKSKSPAPVDEPAKAPKQEDFETVQKYVDALVDWKLQERRDEDAKKAAQSAQAAIESAHQARVKKFAESHPDYQETLEKADLTLALPVLQYIRESELGPDLALHLSQNVEIAERLNRLSPIKALAEIGKIEAKLTPAKADEPKPTTKQPEVSRAPAPITPIEGKKEPVHKDPSEMNFKELRAHNEAQRRLKASKR
jgi:hypothetical protein